MARNCFPFAHDDDDENDVVGTKAAEFSAFKAK